ncbi:MAG TPA: PilX N-terminal domain-containing pilus assembly protein [Deltaproteobacteria bacterium]|nr:PilX N-terminal domain-containing pilus assembly protein [Deltaproteobacteria bacterium]
MEKRHTRLTLAKILEDKDGAVLVMVLIVLVAAIIIGVVMMRSSTLESRMAGNERRYILDFANLESAVNLALAQNTSALSAIGVSVANSFTYSAMSMPGGASVTVRLERISKPPVGSGYDPSFKSRYYTFSATDSEMNQRIEVGAYKVFPPQTE